MVYNMNQMDGTIVEWTMTLMLPESIKNVGCFCVWGKKITTGMICYFVPLRCIVHLLLLKHNCKHALFVLVTDMLCPDVHCLSTESPDWLGKGGGIPCLPSSFEIKLVIWMPSRTNSHTRLLIQMCGHLLILRDWMCSLWAMTSSLDRIFLFKPIMTLDIWYSAKRQGTRPLHLHDVAGTQTGKCCCVQQKGQSNLQVKGECQIIPSRLCCGTQLRDNTEAICD